MIMNFAPFFYNKLCIMSDCVLCIMMVLMQLVCASYQILLV